MSHQIVKQPNGKFAIFSGGVDAFIMYDATKEDILAWARIREMRALEENMKGWEQTFDQVASGGPSPYAQFKKLWDDCMRLARAHQIEPEVVEYLDSLTEVTDGIN